MSRTVRSSSWKGRATGLESLHRETSLQVDSAVAPTRGDTGQKAVLRTASLKGLLQAGRQARPGSHQLTVSWLGSVMAG